MRTIVGVLTALAFAPAAAAAPWTTFGVDPARTGFAPRESALDVTAAPSLRQRWSTPVQGIVDAQPSYVDGLLLVGTEAGELYGLDAATGAVRWRRDLGHVDTSCGDVPGGLHGISAPAVVDPAAGVAYVAGGDDKLHAVELASGAEARGWPVALTADRAAEHVWGALNEWHGRVYAGLASYCDNAFYRGSIVAVDVAAHRVDARLFTVGRHAHGGGVWGWGGVAIDVADGDVYAATANAQGHRQDADLAEHVLRLSARLRVKAADEPPLTLRGDADFGAHPLLMDAPGCPPQLVAMHKSGVLLLYDRRRLARGPRQRLALGDPGSLDAFGTYAYAPPQRRLFVSVPSDGPRYRHGLLAFDLRSDCRLHPAWHARLGAEHELLGVPIVAAGVVWASSGSHLYAIDAATGRRLWSSGTALANLSPAAPVIGDGRLFMGSWDGRVHAFAPGP